MRNSKLLICALFISILGACANNSVGNRTTLPHPRPARFWENGQAVAQVFHVFDRTETDPVTGEVKTGIVTHSGSSAVVDTSGLVLTSSHVVDATTFEPESATHKVNALLVCKIISGKRKCEYATIVAIDKDRDLAWLKTEMKFDQAVMFGPDSELKTGDEVYSWGNVSGVPLSSLRGHYINRMEAADLENGGVKTSTDDKERLIKGPFLLMDLRVGPGSSGGPVFDSLGRCIGITSMNTKEGPTIGYIIPSSTIQESLKSILPK